MFVCALMASRCCLSSLDIVVLGALTEKEKTDVVALFRLDAVKTCCSENLPTISFY